MHTRTVVLEVVGVRWASSKSIVEATLDENEASLGGHHHVRATQERAAPDASPLPTESMHEHRGRRHLPNGCGPITEADPARYR